MNFARANSMNDVRFEMLRAKLESGLKAPAVIGITSAKLADGKDAAARGLADSLVLAGYATLLVDARVIANTSAYAMKGPTLEEWSRSINAEFFSGKLCLLVIDDVVVQQTTSKRQIESALSVLRDKFDYIVIDLDLGVQSAFSESMVQAADAVFVCVRKGRRGGPDDTALAVALDRLGEHFVGLITLEPEIADSKTFGAAGADGARDWYPIEAMQTEARSERREIVKWPT